MSLRRRQNYYWAHTFVWLNMIKIWLEPMPGSFSINPFLSAFHGAMTQSIASFLNYMYPWFCPLDEHNPHRNSHFHLSSIVHVPEPVTKGPEQGRKVCAAWCSVAVRSDMDEVESVPVQRRATRESRWLQCTISGCLHFLLFGSRALPHRIMALVCTRGVAGDGKILSGACASRQASEWCKYFAVVESGHLPTQG